MCSPTASLNASDLALSANRTRSLCAWRWCRRTSRLTSRSCGFTNAGAPWATRSRRARRALRRAMEPWRLTECGNCRNQRAIASRTATHRRRRTTRHKTRTRVYSQLPPSRLTSADSLLNRVLCVQSRVKRQCRRSFRRAAASCDKLCVRAWVSAWKRTKQPLRPHLWGVRVPHERNSNRSPSQLAFPVL